MRRLIALISFTLVMIMTFSACRTFSQGSMIEVSGLNKPSDQPIVTELTTELITDLPTPDQTDEPTQTPSPEPTIELTTAPATESPTPASTSATTPVPPTAAPSENPIAQPSILPSAQPSTQPTEGGKYVYMTFDDGPCGNTHRAIETLNKYNVKATFFTVGLFVDRYPDLVREIVDSGNLIACHSYTHEYKKCYASADAMHAEVEKWEQAVAKAGCELPWRTCFRFPGGSTTSHAKAAREDIISMLHKRGYQWFDWDAGNNDKWPAGNKDNLPLSEYLLNSYKATIRYNESKGNTHVVLLLHDTVKESVDMLPIMIEDLLSKSYEFRTLASHPKWHEMN